MKRIALPLIAASALMAGLASCTSDNNATTGMTQAQIDSAVNVRVEQMRMEMERSNDSLINMMAQVKADSMVAAMKDGAPATRPTAGGGRNTGGNNNNNGGTATPPPPPTVGNGKPVIGDKGKNDGTVGNGKPAIGDKGAQKDGGNTVGNGKPRIGGK